MPKRAKTPPPPEDEPRYLVVVHPYPLHPNLQQHADRRGLALWLACCTGKDALYAMFYKPASPGMVIIEVDRYFERFDSLLGMHQWTSFLKHPTEEEKDKASKIFWCHYNTGRLVQKNGWKRVDVEEHWFNGWSPHNDTIKHPYPKTTYCDVPAEAQTGVPLCRPLPKDTFTPPAPRPRPTVGSVEWTQSRGGKVASGPPSSSRRRKVNHGSQIAPSDSASVVSSAMSDIDALAPPPGQHTVQWVTDQRVRQPKWATPTSSIYTLNSSTASSSVGSRTPSALGAPPAAAPPSSRPSVPARLPGSLGVQSGSSIPAYESFDWSEDLEVSIETQQDDVPTSPHSAGTSTTRAPGGRTARAPEPGAIDPDRDYEYEEEDKPKRSTADAMKAIFDGAPRAAANGPGLHDLEEEEEEDNYVAWNYPQAVRPANHDGTPVDGEEEDVKNPWEGYDAPRWEPPIKVNIKGGEKWICPEHGSTCNPGICKARADVERMRRKEKERDERLEATTRRKEKWRKEAEKKARKIAQAEGREYSHDPPPHFAGHRYRGAAGSGSDSDSDSSSQPSDSPTGSRSQSPPPSSPQDNAAGAEGWAEGGSLWDHGDEEPPKVSLPTGSSTGRSASGSNRAEGEDGARNVGGRTAVSTTNSNINNNNPATRQQSAPPARSAAASSSAWSTSVPPSRGDDPRISSQSPVPGPQQTAWGARGTTTTTSARGSPPTNSQWPAPGQPQSKSNTRSNASVWTTTSIGNGADAAPGPWSRQGSGRQRDRGSGRESTSVSSFSDRPSTEGRAISTSQTSSVSQSPTRMSRAPTSPPGIFQPVDGGFPTFANTSWGDPIAAAQSSSRKSRNSTSGTSSAASRSAVGDDIADGQSGGDNGRRDAETGQEKTQNPTGENDRTGRGRGRAHRRGNRRSSAGRTATSPVAASSTSQDVALPNVLEVSLPPGGPGSHWSNETVEW